VFFQAECGENKLRRVLVLDERHCTSLMIVDNDPLNT